VDQTAFERGKAFASVACKLSSLSRLKLCCNYENLSLLRAASHELDLREAKCVELSFLEYYYWYFVQEIMKKKTHVKSHGAL
jgi:hypothetical protein